MTHLDYSLLVPDIERRMMRGKILTELLGITPFDVPKFRDGWAERVMPGAPIIIAIYTEAARANEGDPSFDKVEAMRGHGLYIRDVADTLVPLYRTFYFAVPGTTDEQTFAVLQRTAIAPIDTNLRWATALGITEETKENQS